MTRRITRWPRLRPTYTPATISATALHHYRGLNCTDPWEALFRAAQASDGGSSNIKPYWIYTRPGGAVIERYVPALPLSREAQQYRRLLRTVGAYRLVIGQPRQDDLVRYVGGDVDWLRIDLTPRRSATN